MTNTIDPQIDEKDPLVDEPAEVHTVVSNNEEHDDPIPYRSENTRKMRTTITFGVSGLIVLFALGFVIGRNTSSPQREADDRNSPAMTEPMIDISDIESRAQSGMTVWDAQLDLLLASYDAGNDNIQYDFSDESIKLSGNGLPSHATGDFPNRANPNAIASQRVEYEIPRQPNYLGEATSTQISGVSLGGIVMVPGTAARDPVSGWSIEAFNVSRLYDPGDDENSGTVRPGGAYSYIGYPAILDSASSEVHSSLIGFAADGFPVYGNRGYRDPTNPDGPVDGMTSSWRLKAGERGPGEPPGVYTGDYTQDFEYVRDSGDLDECNGRFTVTPEFPNGTYAYFMTLSFPFIGRCVNGEIVESFSH